MGRSEYLKVEEEASEEFIGEMMREADAYLSEAGHMRQAANVLIQRAFALEDRYHVIRTAAQELRAKTEERVPDPKVDF